MPPVFTAESVVERLACRIIEASVASVKVGMLGPCNVDLGVIVVLNTVGVDCVASVDLVSGQSVLDIPPSEVVVATVRREERPAGSPRVVG